jgi:hypothetical protein
MATMLTRLGVVTGASTSLRASAAHFVEAMHIALEVRALPAVLEALVELAAVLACEGQAQRAREALNVAVRHPALTTAAQRRAEWLLAALPAGLAGPAGPARSLEAVVDELLQEAEAGRL